MVASVLVFEAQGMGTPLAHSQLPSVSLNALERVEDPDVESLEITIISCGNYQMMHTRGGGDHRVFQQF
ncbi:MAG: hypothetical protein WBQ03_21000, partial [Candidatus Sulfotelmatobacter sp.]